MSRLLSRLILACAAVCAAPIAWFALVFIFADRTRVRPIEVTMLLASAISGGLFVAAWLGIWHEQVVWTRGRCWLTALSVPWSAVAAAVIGVSIVIGTREEEVGVILGSLTWIVAWMASTALVWRETGEERSARLRAAAQGIICCLHCGYNMTGLHEARCPECGTQYTLNELLASITEQAGDLSQE